LRTTLSFLIALALISACSQAERPMDGSSSKAEITTVTKMVNYDAFLDSKDLAIIDSLALDKARIADLKQRPIFDFKPTDVDLYVKYAHYRYPNVRERIEHFAKKNFGQPYDIYLLGEYPFELTDEQPLFDLQKSDCVVYAEHVYAMALSESWKEFFAMLQRIRYEDGVIGYTTRNHFTEADWIVHNDWLVQDITESLGDGITKKVRSNIPKERFFKAKGIENPPANEVLDWSYIPASQVMGVAPQLKTGDFVNVVRGFGSGGEYVGHVGLISVDENDGTVYFVHSTQPEVRMQTLESYMTESFEKAGTKGWFDRWGQWFDNGRAPEFFGFKFLRFNEDAMDNLIAIDGPGAPRLTIYGGK